MSSKVEIDIFLLEMLCIVLATASPAAKSKEKRMFSQATGNGKL